MKIPNSLVPEAYTFSKKVFEQKLTLKEAIEQFVSANRINRNSAADYFNDFKYLMQGRKFARTLNAFSMDYFLNAIYRDYGRIGLQNALKALKLHIQYYEGLQKTTMHKMREIDEKYTEILFKESSEKENISPGSQNVFDQNTIKTDLHELGTIPKEDPFKSRLRIHQAWWRINVLKENCGKHPMNDSKNVCSSINDGELTLNNFLTNNTRIAVKLTIGNRNNGKSGIIEKQRLYNNLLSSQPLCFNFFGELLVNKTLGLKVLQLWWPDISNLNEVTFEYAPKERYTLDNSAFDVAFDASIGEKRCLIGLECKYTDSFSTEPYTRESYKSIFSKSSSFISTYSELTESRYNQLFRNQLIGESLIQNKHFDIIRTGLFCYQYDNNAIKIAMDFKYKLTNPESFKIITYQDYIEKVQTLNLSWQEREWTMLLWARYCALSFSEELNNQIKRLKKNEI